MNYTKREAGTKGNYCCLSIHILYNSISLYRTSLQTQLPEKCCSIMHAICSSKQSTLCARYGFDVHVAIWYQSLQQSTFACLSLLLYAYEMTSLTEFECHYLWTQVSFFPFFCESPLGYSSAAFMLSSFFFPSLSPQALTLVTLIHSIIGKYAFNSLIWQSNG